MSRKGSKDTDLETTDDDVAIIGIGCRFPGASCLREFWQVLVNGENHVVEISDERWIKDVFYDRDPHAPGKTYANTAGFIKNYAHFDFKLFGINEQEASQMDPQQRQVLECTFMALEDAGITRKQIEGEKVGVFIGCMNNDFTQLSNNHAHLIDHHSVTGTGSSIVSNRVSFIFDLRGPSMTIDTACSSSLVAIHQAGLAMKAGDCSMAICGGVNLLLNGGVFIPLSKAQMLSPTGQCRAFSAKADGYTRGEGCGIVIIKPLKQAMKDGDNIWGTIATGLNQDGHVSKPLTAPSGEQQAQLIQDVYSKHGINPASIDYIEAHGTGTKIGDPVEVNAFGHFFMEQQQSKTRYIGSVKTNIGHLESAAGVAGLIKVLLMMKHNTIVPSLHFDNPNEEINFDMFKFQVSLARLWESWGVKPAAVVGQSVGEVAAAHIAGILSLGEAVSVIYHRTNILSKAAGGKMLFVKNLDTKEVENHCAKYKGKISVGLYYSPKACTVSGDASEVNLLKDELSEMGGDITLTDLQVTSAFHSHHMDSCKEQIEAVLQNLKTEKPTVPFISTIDSNYTEEELRAATYWSKNVRAPVKFGEGIKAAMKENAHNVFIEIGPRPVLKAHIDDILQDTSQTAETVPSMTPNSKYENLLKSLGELYAWNCNICWCELFGMRRHTTPEPTHAFEHKHVMAFPVGSSSGTSISMHHLSRDTKLNMHIDPSSFGSIYEHTLKGKSVIPGAAYAETGFAIIRLLKLSNPFASTVSVVFQSPFTLKRGFPADLSVNFTHNGSCTHFEVKRNDIVHAKGKIDHRREQPAEERLDMKHILKRCTEKVKGEYIYQKLANLGFKYGDNFATIDEAHKGQDEALVKMKIPEMLRKEMDHTFFHPAILDGMLQAAAATSIEVDKEFLPVQMSYVHLKQALEAEMFTYTQRLHSTDHYQSFHMKLLSENGRVLGEVGLFKIKFIGRGTYDLILPNWTRMDQVSKVDDALNTKIAVFTDSKVCVKDDTENVYSMDKLTPDWVKNELESAMEGVSKGCFLFGTIDVSTDNGYFIQEELVKRFLSLRLMVLYLSSKQAETPLIIMSEATEAKAATDAAAATTCLNDAITAAARCIIREHKALIIQIVEVVVGTSGELMKNMKHFLSKLQAIPPTKYPEIRFENDSIYTSSMQLISEEGPNYRVSSIQDQTDVLLCSTLDSKIVDPSFVQDIDSQHYVKRDGKDISVVSAVLHKPCLHSITINNQHFRDIHMYPILCFEFVGRDATGNGVVQPQSVALFPSPIKQTVSIPMQCIIDTAKFQWYQPGLMIKLYCLWNLSQVVKMKHVAILFSPETEALSKVLSSMLKCYGTESVALITPEELATNGNCSHRSLITTVMISTDSLTTLVSKWSKLENVITFETINKERTLQFLRSAKSSPTVYIVRPFDKFSPSLMLRNVPKLFAWLRKHNKQNKDLFMSLTSDSSPQDECTPISIAELMQTTCLDLSRKDEFDQTVMKTQVNNLFNRCGSYIVVGGGTGLGWECVSYLAKQGAGCIVILSRSVPKPEKQEEIQSLNTNFGCVVTSIQTDVSDFTALVFAFATIKDKFSEYPLRGIFYGAAIVDDSLLPDMTEEMVRKVVSPKVTGVWNMHVLTARISLDFFVMHSSVVSGIGNAGQSNYGAGNGFMDGLAHLRRRFEMNGQSINWGPLDTGLLERTAKTVQMHLQEKGLLMIQQPDISSCLELTLMLNKVQMFIVNVDRKRMSKQLIRDKEKIVMLRLRDYLGPFLNQLEDSSSEQHFDLAKLRSLDQGSRLHLLKNNLRDLICRQALLNESEIDDDVLLVQQGLDSMNAMGVAERIHEELDVTISAVDIVVKTVSDLASMINEGITDPEVLTEEYERVISQTDIQDSIERHILEDEQQSQNKSGFIFDYVQRLPDVMLDTQIEQIVTECFSRHRIANRTFAFLNSDIKREESTSTDSFETVTGKLATELVSEAHKFVNLEKIGPIKCFFLSDSFKLVLLLHRVAFDRNGAKVLAEELKMFGEALVQGKSLADVHTNPDRNIAKEIQCVLAPKYKHLEAFWKKTLHKTTYATLSKRPKAPSGQYCSGIRIGRRMEDKATDKLPRSQNLTPFDFMISVHQLMVAFEGNTNSPSILIPVDLRQYVPSLAKCVGRCTNYIPVIADIPDLWKTTVETFLTENQKRLQEYKKHGLFLYKNIKALLSEEHMQTNRFIYEDQTDKENFNDEECKSHLTFAPAAETCMSSVGPFWSGMVVNVSSFRYQQRGWSVAVEGADP
ncbi:reducing polyketide synthase BOA6-like [Haliotis rufescens]|uniref:reducing polyketide synthase BOA6-like n=1 Tax=Haliotis rufescens TaxID=6454 RepID=UPI00201F3A89|nr:reducing polyketide synthase BOA6-like [Haliotis rufescens]